MGRRGAGYGEYVVQLQVDATAIVTVLADDEQDAIVKAIERVRPVDVTDVAEAEATIVAGPFESTASTRRRRSRRRAERASKAVGSGGQA